MIYSGRVPDWRMNLKGQHLIRTMGGGEEHCKGLKGAVQEAETVAGECDVSIAKRRKWLKDRGANRVKDGRRPRVALRLTAGSGNVKLLLTLKRAVALEGSG